MNKILMSLLALLLSTVTVFAQSPASDAGKHTTVAPPVITKGYYSIYRNADKLAESHPLIGMRTTDVEAIVAKPGKGYYSMNNHHKKIYKNGVSFIAKKPERPVASKGYYNINPSLAGKEEPVMADSANEVAIERPAKF